MSNQSFDRVMKRKSNWRRWSVGCLALSLIVVLAAVVLLFTVFDDQLAQVKQLLGFSVDSSAAAWVPADALTFVSLNPSFSNLQSFAKLKPIFDRNPGYATLVEGWAQAYTPGAEVKFERDVLPWVGAEMAITLLDISHSSSEPDAPGTPNLAFLARTRDLARSDAAIARIRKDAEGKGWTFVEESYQGAIIVTSKPPGTPQRIGPFGMAQGGAFSTFQGWVLYGSNAGALKKIIDTRLAGEQHSLRRNPAYRSIIDKLPPERAAALFVDIGALIKQTPSAGSVSSAELDNVQGLGVAASFADDGIRFDYLAVFNQNRAPASLKKLLASYKPNAGHVLEHIPASGIFVLSGQDLKAQWDYHSDIWLRDPQMHLQDSVDNYKAQTGLDLEQDVVSWLTGEYALSVVRTPSSEGVLLVVQVNDQSLVAGKMDKLLRALLPKTQTLRTKTINGVDMQVLPTTPDGDKVGFGYGFVDQYLIIGSDEETLSLAVDAGKNPLSADADFRKATAPLPATNIGISYLSIPKLLNLIKGSYFGPSKETLTLLEPFNGVSIAFGVPQDNAQAAVLFVRVIDPSAGRATAQDQAALQPSATPTLTAEPPTPLPLPTLTPTSIPPSPTPTLNVAVRNGTPLARPAVAISAVNAERVVRLARWGRGRPVYAMAWSARQKIIAAARPYGVSLYNSDTLAEVRFLDHPSLVSSVAFNADGTLLASGSFNNSVRLWRVSDGSLVREFLGHIGAVYSVALNADGTLLASGAYDNSVRLWRVSDGTLLREFKGNAGAVLSVAFNPDGTLLASGDQDNTVRLWRVSDGNLMRELKGHSDLVFSVAFNADGTLLASGSDDNSVRLWRVSDGSLLRELKGYTVYVRSVSFSLDGTLLASASADNSARLWRVSDGRLLHAVKGNTVAFSADGTRLASSSVEGIVRLWQVDDGSLLRESETHYAVSSVAVSADGNVLGSEDNNQGVQQWRLSDGSLVRELKEATGSPLAFSSDGTQVASRDGDGTVRLWRLSGSGPPRELKGQTSVYCAAFSPDGNLLATGGYQGVLLWRVSDGSQVRTLPMNTPPLNSVAFSADGTLLASGGQDNTVRLWRVSDGSLLRTLQGHTDIVQSLAFSPDGTLLASGSHDTDVRLWRVSDGSLVRELKTSANSVTSLAFSHDGTLLASGNWNNTVVLWRVSDGGRMRELQAHSAVFTADGTVLVSEGGDGTIGLWGVAP